MNNGCDLLKRAALGAAGGFAGTLALQGLLSASMKWLPGTVPPLREEPGEFMVHRAEEALPEEVRDRIPEPVETVAAKALGIGYGLTFGALYGALHPRGSNPVAGGLVLGLACWAAGYLGWLPALGLMPPVWKQKPGQALGPVVEHLAYGVVTAAACDLLEERVAV